MPTLDLLVVHDIMNSADSNELAKCPRSQSAATAKPVECPHQNLRERPAASGCPVQASDVSSLNQMPKLSQVPSPDQSQSLDTTREISSIPKGAGTDETAEKDEKWVYPSQQQFYNALVKKGHQTEESDVEMILFIHNEMNEKSWNEVVGWEKQIHSGLCHTRLLRFRGRPTDMSPKAWFNSTFWFTI